MAPIWRDIFPEKQLHHTGYTGLCYVAKITNPDSIVDTYSQKRTDILNIVAFGPLTDFSDFSRYRMSSCVVS